MSFSKATTAKGWNKQQKNIRGMTTVQPLVWKETEDKGFVKILP